MPFFLPIIITLNEAYNKAVSVIVEYLTSPDRTDTTRAMVSAFSQTNQEHLREQLSGIINLIVQQYTTNITEQSAGLDTTTYTDPKQELERKIKLAIFKFNKGIVIKLVKEIIHNGFATGTFESLNDLPMFTGYNELDNEKKELIEEVVKEDYEKIYKATGHRSEHGSSGENINDEERKQLIDTYLQKVDDYLKPIEESPEEQPQAEPQILGGKKSKKRKSNKRKSKKLRKRFQKK